MRMRRLFVVGDSHATAYFSLLADYTRATRVPVALHQTPGCYFVHLVPSPPGCAAIVDVVLDEIRKGFEGRRCDLHAVVAGSAFSRSMGRA